MYKSSGAVIVYICIWFKQICLLCFLYFKFYYAYNSTNVDDKGYTFSLIIEQSLLSLFMEIEVWRSAVLNMHTNLHVYQSLFYVHIIK